jgi:ribulose-phosphate 3-epimerase
MRSKNLLIPAIETTRSAEFLKQIEFANKVGNSVHIDLTDGLFSQVPTLQVKDWPEFKVEYSEVHLMVKKPVKYIDDLAAKKVTRAIVHIESSFDVEDLAAAARKADLLLGFAVSPDTDLDHLRLFYDYSTYIQIMGVYPGKSGQAFIPSTLPAVSFVRKQYGGKLTVTVDGGVHLDTIAPLRKAGVNYLVSGSAIFDHISSKWEKSYEELQQRVA